MSFVLEYIFEEQVAKIIQQTMFDIEIQRDDYIAEKWLDDIIDALDLIVKQPFPEMYPKYGQNNYKVTKNGKKIYFVIKDKKIIVRKILF